MAGGGDRRLLGLFDEPVRAAADPPMDDVEVNVNSSRLGCRSWDVPREELEDITP